jgi:hypothetical protein
MSNYFNHNILKNEVVVPGDFLSLETKALCHDEIQEGEIIALFEILCNVSLYHRYWENEIIS